MDERKVRYIPILDLENQIEAQIVGAHLTDQGIPHRVHTNGDPAYAGIFQTQLGWGFIEAPAEYRDTIVEVYSDLTGKTPSTYEQ
jgi:hypothetical protein